ncbi:MAG: FHA domain-containing protein [Pseudomonadota bacterium]
MAILKNNVSNQKIILRTCHTFGRDSKSSDTFLENRHVSQIHASIRWDGTEWEILDHSRNGTFLDGTKLSNSKRVVLRLKSKIQFSIAENSTWVVEDLAPPCAALVPTQRNDPIIELKEYTLLPDDALPEAAIHLGETGQWILENNQKTVLLKNMDTVCVGQHSWQFVCPQELEQTIGFEHSSHFNPERIAFHFQVSLNEEHVSLKIVSAGKTIDLEERTHHYFLLTLARKRLDDANRRIDSASQGWIDLEKLSRMLGLDSSHMNIQIFRARSQFAKALDVGSTFPNIIERRRGEARFGAFEFHIMRGASVEGEFNPIRSF